MRRKLAFYRRYGVEEYYLYDPDTEALHGWQRRQATLRAIPRMDGWVSPRLGIRFVLRAGALQVYHPDGSLFTTLTEVTAQRDQARQEALQAQRDACQAQQEALQAQQREAQAQQRLAQMAARLRALGLEVDDA